MGIEFKILGSSGDADAFFSQHVAERIKALSPETVTVTTEIFLEIDYFQKLKDARPIYGPAMYGHTATHCIIRDGVLIGTLMSLIKIATEEFGIEDAEIANVLIFEKKCKEETSRLLSKTGHPAAYLELSRADLLPGEDAPHVFGKLIIELGTKGTVALKDSKEVKLHYLGSPLHRCVVGGWLQGGDIVDGSGLNSYASVGNDGRFRDESFSVDFGGEVGGIVGYSTKEPHGNGSQFFITLGPMAWMNNKSVGFGRIVQGFPILRAIEASPVNNERPTPAIIISECGQIYVK